VGVSAATRPGTHILDLACGPGVKSFVLAQADATARVTVHDRPKVLDIAARIAAAMGVAGQVRYQSGDVLACDVGMEWYDLVLLGNVLHYFPLDQMQALLRTAHRALKRGGLVLIDDGILDEERCRAEDVLLAAVEMVNSAPYAEFCTFSEYKTVSESAGFIAVILHGPRPVSARKSMHAGGAGRLGALAGRSPHGGPCGRGNCPGGRHPRRQWCAAQAAPSVLKGGQSQTA
jgi:SAM-dependent methyltransferase